jgi:hypothetical protein
VVGVGVGFGFENGIGIGVELYASFKGVNRENRRRGDENGEIFTKNPELKHVAL